MKSLVSTVLLALTACLAQAQDKVTFLTSWYAQAEHGGYYQAIANGIYKKHGLDVTVKMGGPQVNAIQIIAAGQADFIMGKDFQTLSAIENGVSLTTVAKSVHADAPIDVMRRDEQHMLSDRPGMIMRKRLLDLLKDHGETEVHGWSRVIPIQEAATC